LQADPNYALAYAELGNAYYLLSGWYLPAREAMPLARQYAEKALGIDAGLAEGMTIRGLVTFFYDWRFDEGLRQLRAGVARNPGSMLAHQWYAYVLTDAGQFGEARAQYSLARELDPISEQLHWFSIWPAYYERRYQEAVTELNTLRAVDKSFWGTYSL